jgi:hypothetical protein
MKVITNGDEGRIFTEAARDYSKILYSVGTAGTSADV